MDKWILAIFVWDQLSSLTSITGSVTGYVTVPKPRFLPEFRIAITVTGKGKSKISWIYVPQASTQRCKTGPKDWHQTDKSIFKDQFSVDFVKVTKMYWKLILKSLICPIWLVPIRIWPTWGSNLKSFGRTNIQLPVKQSLYGIIFSSNSDVSFKLNL